jgi:outer membrane protein OmpA-like peptidoglycan-associated protein
LDVNRALTFHRDSFNPPKHEIMVRHLLLTLLVGFLVAGALPLHAQKHRHKLADQHYTTFNFKKAAEIYEDILKRRPDDALALRRAGESRIRLDQHLRAEPHFQRLSTLPDAKPEDLLRLAYVLKVNQKYDAAVMVYERYLAFTNDAYLVGYTDNDWASRIVRDSARFEIRTTFINSPESDFAPAFSDEGVIFASARKQGKGKRRTYNWTDQSYLNMYRATVNPDSSLSQAKVIKNKTNSRYHEGTISFDRKQKVVYFTRNNHHKGKRNADDDNNLNLGIYYASYSGTEIGKVKPFPFNDPAYSIGHPVISADGKAMYFVSDMPGGYGGTDIYVSYRNLDFWSNPVNAGPKINTPGNEMFPFIDAQNTFYFSSDWHPGLGGLDLFYTVLDDESVPVRNFGYPVNSSFDDFGLITYSDGLRGYFSSNRPGGEGDDDIYEFIVRKAETIEISGKVIDIASMSPIPNATILLKDAENREVLQVVANTDAEGNYRFQVPYDQTYTIIGVKNGYFQKEVKVNSSDKSGYLDRVDLPLTAYAYAAEGRVYYADDGKPAEGATVLLKNIDGVVLQEMVVTEDGLYHFGLSQESQYNLEAFKTAYPPQSIALDTRGKPATIIYSDLQLFAYEKGKVIRLDNIYYDYDRHEIRNDAARELDRLVKILLDNPTMKIELSSHTDARGSDAYNLRLSQRRAQSAVEYLITKGISRDRLTAKGYGETRLLNHCGNDAECTDTEHQYNRRTEFTILDL